MYAKLSLAACLALLALTGCTTVKPYDYTNFRAHPPRSILVLPPLNESTEVAGTYGYLSTVTQPIAERGYYVFPVEVVDQFLKQNGMPTAGEMHQVPLKKVSDIIGADAVLFLNLKQYGSKYVILNSVTTVVVEAKLVDTRSGIILWEGLGSAEQRGGSSGNLLASLVAAAITQAINSKTDRAHQVSRLANAQMFYAKDTGLPYGPYSPEFGKGP
jgi:hypothetical protein